MITTIRKWHSNLQSHLQSPSQGTSQNHRYKHSLYLTISTSLLIIILILTSLIYQFPGPNNSLLDIVGPDITYKIYMFQYCVSAGDRGDGGVDRDVYAADGAGCHLDFNQNKSNSALPHLAIGYIVSATKIQASATDLHLFHHLTAAAFSFYYIGIHIQILLSYLFIRSFLRTGKILYVKLLYFLGFQTTIYLIPACCLTTLTYLARRITTTSDSESESSSPYKHYSKIGNLYALFLHSFWIICLVTLFVVFFFFYRRDVKRVKEVSEKEEDELERAERIEREKTTGKHVQETEEKWEEAKEEWGEQSNKSTVYEERRKSNPHAPEILNHWNEPNKVA
ncbi:hypothetical protein EAF04_004204 [Stromatinia cepivora]|nr:hypothetical protein EAF04_004204 [Stromatinia cepivora]